MRRLLSDEHYLAQLARFLVIGLVNTIFGLSVFTLCILLGANKNIALAISTVIGVLFNFQTIGRLVFRSYKPDLLLRFSISYVIIFVANLIALNALFRFGVQPIPAQTILTPFFAALTFLINRTLIFRTANGTKPPSVF